MISLFCNLNSFFKICYLLINIIVIAYISRLFFDCTFIENNKIVYAEGCIINKKREGLWLIRDGISKNLISIGYYKNNIKEGTWVDYYDTSVLIVESVYKYKNDSITGRFYEYNKNGELYVIDSCSNNLLKKRIWIKDSSININEFNNELILNGAQFKKIEFTDSKFDYVKTVIENRLLLGLTLFFLILNFVIDSYSFLKNIVRHSQLNRVCKKQ